MDAGEKTRWKVLRATRCRVFALAFLALQTSVPRVCAEPPPATPAAPARVSVESSVIASVGYDAEARALDIEFRSGTARRYLDVPPEIHRALLDAESKGRFYNANIRHRFKSEKLAPDGSVVHPGNAAPHP